MKLILAAAILIALAGCKATGVDGSHSDRMNVRQGDPTHLAVPSAPAEMVAPPAPSNVPGPTSADLEHVRSETFASNTAQQNEITGLGVQVGKVAEKVEGVHAEVSARLDNVINTTAELKVSVNQRFDAQAELNAKVVADLRAEFKADIKAEAQVQASAIAGVDNKINTVQTSTTTSSALNSGRDSISFTPEMARMIVDMSRDDAKTLQQVQHDSSNALIAIVGTLCGVMTALSELRSRRSENQHKKFLETALAPESESNRETVRYSDAHIAPGAQKQRVPWTFGC